MLKLLKPIFVLALFLLAFGLKAQNYYTVQVGTYQDAQLNDFDAIKSYGHVYANIQLDNSKQVHLGGFASKSMADRALRKVKAKGFRGAFVKTNPLRDGSDIRVVQIATHTLGQSIPWAQYLNMGSIYTVLDGQKIKIISGVFGTIEDAKERLHLAKARGFEDAFIKQVNSQILHKVSKFETKGLEQMATVEYSAPTSSTYSSASDMAYADLTPRGASVPPSYESYGTFSSPRLYEIKRVKSYMPSISYKQKKNAIKWLQEVLQQTGVYTGKISSYYNTQVASAYESAKTKNYQLARFANQFDGKTYGDFRDWKDIQLLLNITNSLTPYGERSTENAIKSMYTKPETLDLNELQLIVSWDYRFRRGLKAWANADTLRGEMARAIKIAYLQAQLRLENYYKKQGYNTEQSQGLALTTLRLLVGKQLARFDNY